MAITDTITVNHITEDPESGAMEVEIDWNGQIYPQVFTSRARMAVEKAGGITSPDEAVNLLFHWWLARDPDASTDALVVGKVFKIDFGDPNPIKVN
jgi:hypothetical protein